MCMLGVALHQTTSSWPRRRHIYLYIHACIHTYTHTYIHTYICIIWLGAAGSYPLCVWNSSNCSLVRGADGWALRAVTLCVCVEFE